MREPRLIDSEEIEMYESKEDYIALALTLVGVIIGIAVILWEPPVEAIGTWIYELLNN